MDCSTPGFPVHHQLLDYYSNSCPSSWWCHPTISSSVVPFSSHLQSFPASGSLSRSQFFTLGGQSIGASTSASVLPANIQDWFSLGLTGWISLQSKGLSRVFSHITVQKHLFFSTMRVWRGYSKGIKDPLWRLVVDTWKVTDAFWTLDSSSVSGNNKTYNQVLERTKYNN